MYRKKGPAGHLSSRTNHQLLGIKILYIFPALNSLRRISSIEISDSTWWGAKIFKINILILVFKETLKKTKKVSHGNYYSWYKYK